MRRDENRPFPRVRPCEALCGLFRGRAASVYPCGGFCQRWGSVAASSGKEPGKPVTAGFQREMAGSKRVQVKGRVALKSPLARFTPPGKAVRGFRLPPGKSRF